MPHAPAETLCYVGLGSNLGDRWAHLREAVRALSQAEGVVVEAASPVYESAAHTLRPGEAQPPYLNAVVALRIDCGPHALLGLLRDLEAAAGRVRDARWAPRPLDLDVLLFGDRTLATPHLRVPHPRLAERRFVLRPLCDLAPNLTLPPPFDAPAVGLLAACPDTGALTRVPGDLLAAA